MPAHRTRDIQISRSLEVTTDCPQDPPSLSIITPTPRAFTFPIHHQPHQQHHDSPYSSPSSSPFEPDLRTLTITPPPHMLIRTLSPLSPPSSIDGSGSPSSPATHKRRKSSSSSSSSDIIERRPKKGDEDYIKRPENAFILFRRKCCEDRQAAHDEADTPTKKQRQADLSKTISQQWKSLPAEERQYWEDLAKEKKKEHEAMYPNYVYRPQRTNKGSGANKDGSGNGSNNNKVKGRKMPFDGSNRREYDFETDNENVSFVLPFGTPSRHGRSASAPTPPLGYQQIVVPNVYHPSCPTSPSLMPMIERRSSHPGHPEGVSRFDYLPNDNLMPPPSFPQDYQPTMHSAEFFHNMFDMSGHPPPPDRPTHTSLHPLTVQTDPSSMLLPAHQLISPASSTSESSGPSSPHSALYTPTHIFNQPPPPHQQHVQQQPQADNSELQLTDFEFGWDNDTSLWATTGSGGEVLLGEDFDLSSIPAIELGLSKMGAEDPDNVVFGHLVESPNVYDHPAAIARHESLEGLFDFEDMMASNGF